MAVSRNSKGVTPALAIILIVGLAAVLVTFAAGNFFQLAGFADKEPIRTTVDHSSLPNNNGTQARVLDYGNAEEIYLSPPKGSSKSKVLLSETGGIGSIEDGDGVYRVVGVIGDSRQVLSTIIIDGPVALKIETTNTEGNTNSFKFTSERVDGDKTVEFNEFKIEDVGVRGDVGPASGVSVSSTGGSGGSYSGVISFGNEYEFDSNPSIGQEGESITVQTNGVSDSVNTLAVSPKSTFTDIRYTLEGNQTTVTVPLVINSKVLTNEGSPYPDIEDENLVVASDNVSVNGVIKNISGGIAGGQNMSVGDEITNIGGDVLTGNNSTIEDSVTNITGDVDVSNESHVDGNIIDTKNVSMGKNTSVNGDIQSTDNVSVGRNSTINGFIADIQGDVKVGYNSTIMNNITNVTGDVAVKNNGYVDGDMKHLGSTSLGDNTTVNGDVENVSGDFEIGKNSNINGYLVDITGNATVGQDSTVNGELQNITKVTLKDGSRTVGVMNDITKIVAEGDNTIESSPTNIDDKIVAYSGTVFESDVPSSVTVTCPDGPSTVTFQGSGRCQ